MISKANLSYFLVNRNIFLASFSRNVNIEPLYHINSDDINPEFEQHYINSDNMNLDFEQPEMGIIKSSQSELLTNKLQLFVLPFS